MSSPPASLARCVGEVDGFLSSSFTVAPHRWHDEGFDDLLSVADLDRQLSGSGLRRPVVRLVCDGEPIDPSTWTRRARTGSTWVDDLVDPARLFALFDGGATVAVQSLHRWWPPLSRFCRDLEAALGHPVQANAYLTPPGAAGLAPHHDTHDVFVLQVHGTKHWIVREPLVEAPLARHRSDHEAAAAQPVMFEADLGPGDCLYLPRGFVHSATAQAGTSLHLTIGVLASTVHDLLRRLVDRAVEDPAFRRNLPGSFEDDGAVMERAVKGAVHDFVRWLDELDPDEITDALRRRGSRSKAPLLDGQLLELIDIDLITDDTAVTRRSGGSVVATTVDQRLHLVSGDRTIDLPPGLEEPVGLLLDGSPHRVGDLANWLDGQSRLVLVRRLVREGVLRTDHAH